jgi:C4-dicarboxylate-specific signal transduction histidine kinase
MYHFWEMGVSIHDILVASGHAVHVLKSIKQLSVSDQARSDVNLHETISEALTLLKKLVTDVQVKVRSDAKFGVTANKGELVQIWVNLIRNACESMQNAEIKDPELTIETSRKRGYVWVAVSDNGPGIPEDLHQKIFQPNFTTKIGGLSFGLGLGLTIVQRLVDSYGGKIEVASKPGKTTFTVKLPSG